jgi:hypothetical protein
VQTTAAHNRASSPQFVRSLGYCAPAFKPDQFAVAVKLIVLLMAAAAAENGIVSLNVYAVLP